MSKKTQTINSLSGSRFKQALKDAGYTHAQFAELVGVSDKYIGFMCQGTRAISPRRADQFAKFLGVRAEYLLGRDDYKTNSLSWLKSETSKKVKDQIIIEKLFDFFGYAIIGNEAIYEENQNGESEVVDMIFKIRAPGGATVEINAAKLDTLEIEILRAVKRFLVEAFGV